VTLPAISTSLISGALLAFALSFDEVIVTTFTSGVHNTLPIWIFGRDPLGKQRSGDVTVHLRQLLAERSWPKIQIEACCGRRR